VIEPGFSCLGEPSACRPGCGNGTTAANEGCDDGRNDDGDGCSASCLVERGFACTGTPSACTSACGDGVTASDEGCDDGNGNVADGCDATCTVETGWDCVLDGNGRAVCVTTCGDGLQVATEGCDDRNTTDGDGCSATCTVENGSSCTGSPSACSTTCGDGVRAGAESCDDRNTTDGDGCSATCTVESGYSCTGSRSACSTTCGDGIRAGAEGCDDQNLTGGDGCSATCTAETGFTCNGTRSTCSTTCGDGIRAGAEGCDDQNLTGGDGCSATCTVETGFTCNGTRSTCSTNCGDGIRAGAEGCDDQNLTGGDGCSATCTVETGFTCNGTRSTCSTTCGDGIRAGAEGCDDDGTSDGDGCSATCTVESGFTCNGSPSVCTASGTLHPCEDIPGKASHATIVIGRSASFTMPMLTAEGSTIRLEARVNGLSLSSNGGAAPTQTFVDATAVSGAFEDTVVGGTDASPAGECVSIYVVDTARANVVSYTGASGGSWTNAANWSPARVPGAQDTAYIASARHVAIPASSSSDDLVVSTSRNIAALWVENGGSVTLAAGTLLVVTGDVLVGGRVSSPADAGLQPSSSGGRTAGRIDTLVCNSGAERIGGPTPPILLGGPVDAVQVVESVAGNLVLGGTCAIDFAAHRLSTTAFLATADIQTPRSSILTMEHARAQLAVDGNLSLDGTFTWTDGSVETIGANRTLRIRQTAPTEAQTGHRLVVHGGATVDIPSYQGAIVGTGGTGGLALTVGACANPRPITVLASALMTGSTQSVCVGTLLTRSGYQPMASITADRTVNCDTATDAACAVFER
jgi:cysteine-rich repeat protein